jgi:hypothetical protein
LKEN